MKFAGKRDGACQHLKADTHCGQMSSWRISATLNQNQPTPPDKACFSFTYPGDVLNPEQADDNVIVGGPGQKLHCHGSKLLQPRLWPILQTRLGRGRWREKISAQVISFDSTDAEQIIMSGASDGEVSNETPEYWQHRQLALNDNDYPQIATIN